MIHRQQKKVTFEMRVGDGSFHDFQLSSILLIETISHFMGDLLGGWFPGSPATSSRHCHDMLERYVGRNCWHGTLFVFLLGFTFLRTKQIPRDDVPFLSRFK